MSSAVPSRAARARAVDPAILCAVPVERRAVVGLSGAGRVVAGGIGPRAAARAARDLLADGPSFLLAAGFCGALDPERGTADVIAATTVIDGTSGEEFPADPALLAAAPGHHGALCSTPRIITDRAVRDALPGIAVDMESAAAAREARDAEVPFLAIRAVTDAAHHRMPDLSGVIDLHGELAPGDVARHIAQNPSDIMPTLRLGLSSARAARALRRAVGHVLTGA